MSMPHQHDENCTHDLFAFTQSLPEIEFERSLHGAAQSGNIEKVFRILSSPNCDVNTRDTFGYSALHYASRGGHLEICKLLVLKGANVNAQTELGATPLLRATLSGQIEIIRFLLNNGADINIADKDGRTVLKASIFSGREDIEKEIQRAYINCAAETRPNYNPTAN
ncbi:hypothetical protein HK096_003793 [Nowakowskiella sp. JEL0078]|nr:hypothetical protein HK096_003793 [Nowakowskiella sp. JEL0078]